eukprot:482093-Alexandrium_andersonii.AAC.1
MPWTSRARRHKGSCADPAISWNSSHLSRFTSRVAGLRDPLLRDAPIIARCMNLFWPAQPRE